jgi:hypothetical protein
MAVVAVRVGVAGGVPTSSVSGCDLVTEDCWKDPDPLALSHPVRRTGEAIAAGERRSTRRGRTSAVVARTIGRTGAFAGIA